MKLATWNIRWLNDSSKHTEIRKIIFDNNLDLICIVETKVRLGNVARIKEACFPTWGLLHNTPTNGVGRVWIAWNRDTMDVQLLKLNIQSILSCHY